MLWDATSNPFGVLDKLHFLSPPSVLQHSLGGQWDTAHWPRKGKQHMENLSKYLYLTIFMLGKPYQEMLLYLKICILSGEDETLISRDVSQILRESIQSQVLFQKNHLNFSVCLQYICI